MARGMFSGLIWGVVVAGLGAGGLSLAYPDFKPSGVAVANDAPAPSSAGLETAPAPAPDAQIVEETPKASETSEVASEAVAEPDVVEDAIKELAEEMAAPTVTEETVPNADVVAETTGLSSTPVKTDNDDAQVVEDIAQPTVVPSDSEVFDPSAEPEPVVADVLETETATTEDTASADDLTAQAPAETAEAIAEEESANLPVSEGTVGNLAPEVKTNRLPSVSDTPEPAEDLVPEPSALAPPPFERFAVPIEVDASKPKMSIVLIDQGDDELGVEALEAFPYPITFAVDASATNAQDRMQIFRDKGFEVLALIGLPLGATASDAEVAMSAYMSAVPEAVAFLETPDVSLQTSRELTDQITKIVQESGHGIVLQANGLNTAQKLAQREGIPSATVFRDFDGKDQKAGVIRRFLDQAAFKAGQEGGVIMLGRLRPETISALLIWGLADRANRVALVPVTSVLRPEDASN